jgi:alkanesulfonate monooxygenase SsuD/methylene tetrahydromethanopterin reductase-like flavin-dependent oxidoreductase (luciferase family)
MRIGITAPMWSPNHSDLTADYVAGVAQRIEQTGFDGIWLRQPFASEAGSWRLEALFGG